MKTSALLVCIVLVGFVTSILALTAAQCKQEGSVDALQLFPVGKVKKDSGATTIEIYKGYADALLGLNQFSHLVVLYWFDKNDTPEMRKTLRVHPRHNMSNPLTGVFATRSPRRPNLIGLSVCKILSVKNNVIRIDSIDAFHGTPVLDLKPYVPRMDRVHDASGPKWAD
ncbi:MAG: tRNA (N6-threonylcarbamoyladenosine(37)-N6)-methyltransferase TrmO [Thermodesulfobacteriota bacterium]|nr:tRNA (N6-threonylcarbamoyladenosine(37)-N6)-methyltransferase TrmO [Thermodesulfobacteriota bacterium]